MEVSEKEQALLDEYHSLVHAMQSGVAWMEARDASDLRPKHLRVGINSAKVEIGALSRMLVKKGICTFEEILEEMITGMKDEVASYERTLGPKVTLR